MNLVVLCLDYPYYIGEPFMEDELRVAEDYFDMIYIVTLTGHAETIKKYVPHNGQVICARKKRYEIPLLIKSFFKLFSVESIKEYLYARKKLGYHFKAVVPQLFIYYYYFELLRRVFKNYHITRDAIIYSYWMAQPAYFLAKSNLQCKKKITRTHRFDCFIKKCYQPFRREILENLDEIYSISEAGANDLKLNFSAYKHNNIFISRLGIFKAGSVLNPDKESDILQIVTCSNISKVKRLDILIDALQNINFKINWVHIGDGELEEEIKHYSSKLNANKYVNYTFVGRKSKNEILEYYANNHIDIFVNCSDSEGIPVSIMEAMAYGIPAVVRDVGGNSEIVNSNNGIILKTNSTSNDFKQAIEQFNEQSYSMHQQMRKAAFNTFCSKYNASKNYVEFFEKLKKI